MAISIPILCIIFLEIIEFKDLTLITQKSEKAQYFYYANLISTILTSMTVIGFFLYTFRRQTNLLAAQTSQLQHSKASMIQTFQIARIGFSEVDLQNRISYWGPGLKKIIGVPEDFAPSFDLFFKMVHPEDLSRVQLALKRSGEEGEQFVQTYRIIRPLDGRTITLKSYGRVVLGCNGTPLKLHAVVRDITEEKKQEEQIKKEKERAEAADLAKSLFLSNISHEIRTPLHGLLGFAKLLERTQLDDEQHKQLSMLQYSGEILMTLLNDILDITQIEQGRVELKNEAFELTPLVENCLAPYEFQAREKGLGFSMLSNVGRSAIIYSDPLRIKQILINLVTNAIKYTDEGRVKVDIRLFDDEAAGNLALQLAVTDTGKGIPAEFQEDIFHSFTQLNTDVPMPSKGLGLGLAIVRNLVAFLGGNIQLKSPWSHDPRFPGSRFLVTLPVEKGFLPKKLEKVHPQEWNLAQPLKILVAEDNEVNQILIKMSLQQANFEVMMVSNGKEAVDFVHAFPVDLVLMDVQMPVMDGYMATREIRKYRPDLPILALSANAFKEDIEKSIRCGMNAHLSKPFRLEDLLGKIATFFPAFHR